MVAKYRQSFWGPKDGVLDAVLDIHIAHDALHLGRDLTDVIGAFGVELKKQRFIVGKVFLGRHLDYLIFNPQSDPVGGKINFQAESIQHREEHAGVLCGTDAAIIGEAVPCECGDQPTAVILFFNQQGLAAVLGQDAAAVSPARPPPTMMMSCFSVIPFIPPSVAGGAVRSAPH